MLDNDWHAADCVCAPVLLLVPVKFHEDGNSCGETSTLTSDIIMAVSKCPTGTGKKASCQGSERMSPWG